ncbi:glycoside hydrolase family 12 protein [Hypoxylon sp. FL1150]|nr:glycoside hydrolase family 12 protein [Hypoxylon sp. FL1150]
MKPALTVATLAASATAHSRSEGLQQRATTVCGQWDSVEMGTYTVYQDLWGMDSGTGSQRTTGRVKSFANVVTDITIAQLSSISSIPSTWAWSNTGSDIIADVAYDLFTSSSTGGSAEYGVMIWLAALGGAGPITSTGSPVTSVTIEGVTWDLYDGYNGAMHVFSFVALSQVTKVSGDLVSFFTYLISSRGMPSSQYLQSVGAGTEPFKGSNAVIDVSSFSLAAS